MDDIHVNKRLRVFMRSDHDDKMADPVIQQIVVQCNFAALVLGKIKFVTAIT